MNEHRHITETGITEEGGIIHIFEDGSHTYIQPEIVKDIFIDYINLIPNKIEEE